MFMLPHMSFGRYAFKLLPGRGAYVIAGVHSSVLPGVSHFPQKAIWQLAASQPLECVSGKAEKRRRWSSSRLESELAEDLVLEAQGRFQDRLHPPVQLRPGQAFASNLDG